MLPILPKTGKLNATLLNRFGGLNRSLSFKENEFSDLNGADNDQFERIKTIGSFPKLSLPEGFAGTPFLTFQNEEGNYDTYDLRPDGFYKNGQLLPFHYLRTVPSNKYLDISLCQGVTLTPNNNYYRAQWNGSAEDTKLLRFGDYIFAFPQMLATDGDAFWKWNGETLFHLPRSACSVSERNGYTILRLTLDSKSDMHYIFEHYAVGERIQLGLNGQWLSWQLEILSKEDTLITFQYQDSDGNPVSTNSSGNFMDNNSILVRKKAIPDFTDVTVAYNRMWAVHKNRIFCSKLGNPLQFDGYELASSDPWWADTESTQNFTAVAALNGRVAAFKKNAAYEIYGVNAPFTVKDTSRSYGCADRKSLCELNGILMLLTTEGICAYGGSRFVNLSEELGSLPEQAVGCACGSRYYLLSGSGLYKYDYYKGVWTCLRREGAVNLFQIDDCALAFLEDGALIQLCGGEKPYFTYDGEFPQSWSITSVKIGEADFYADGVNRLEFQLTCESPGTFVLEVSGGGKPFETKYTETLPGGDQILTIPVAMRLCPYFQYRLSGTAQICLNRVRCRWFKGGHAKYYEQN